MNIKHINGKQGGNLKFEVDGVVLYFWDSFKRSLISLDDFSQSYNFNKVMFKDTPEDIIAWIEKNKEFVNSYIAHASAEQKRIDSFKTLPKKKLVARTEENVLIVTVSLERGYVSVTANQVSPMREKDMIKMGTDSLMDYYVGERGMSKKEAKAQVQQDINVSGVEAVWDISLFSEPFDYKRTTYSFSSDACGCLHTETKKAFPENKILHKLIKLHLDETANMTEVLWLFSQLTSCEDYKSDVIIFGKEIVSGV